MPAEVPFLNEYYTALVFFAYLSLASVLHLRSVVCSWKRYLDIIIILVVYFAEDSFPALASCVVTTGILVHYPRREILLSFACFQRNKRSEQCPLSFSIGTAFRVVLWAEA